MTFEVIAAAALLRKIAPSLRVRVVNVTDLMALGAAGTHPHALTNEAFNNLFTNDRRIHFNYHGYAVEIQVNNHLLVSVLRTLTVNSGATLRPERCRRAYYYRGVSRRRDHYDPIPGMSSFIR
jgi:hypothetical protein